jgi:CDP-diacylglycerol--serine O-phosphatidyltransferase
LIYRKAILPNLLTLGNLFLGFNAILMISRDHLLAGSWFIIVAAILDGLDGTVARLVRSDSPFGREIDSLVDVVSFGVAPALLIHHMVAEPLGLAGLLFAFLPLLAGVLRLARFNVTSSILPRRRTFQGLPITSAAGVMASFNIYMNTINADAASLALWFSLVPALSLLMISPFPYRKLPGIGISGLKYPQLGIGALILVAFVVLWNPALTLFPIGLLYMLSGPVEYGLIQLRKVRTQSDHEDLTTPEPTSKGGISRRNRGRSR